MSEEEANTAAAAEQPAVTESITIQLHIEFPDDKERTTLSISTAETILDIKQVISSLPKSTQYTNFSLTYDSFKIDESLSLAELIGAHELEEVTELTLHLREDPYTEATAREHILKVRELLGLEFNATSSVEGVYNGCSKFQNLELNEIQPPKAAEDTKEDKDASKVEELAPEQKLKAVSATESILKPAMLKEHSVKSKFSIPPAVRSLAVSVWNPPTSFEVLKGDLIYLQAMTLEGETFQITSNVAGFFVNKSSSSNFDGSLKKITTSHKKTISRVYHSLLELLTVLSPKLTEQLQASAKLLAETQPEIYMTSGNSFLANPWIVNAPSKRQPDLARSQLNYLVGGPDGADLSKDWNEEYQSIRELPHETFPERLMRERLLNRLGYEFTNTAAKTAIAIARGELQPLVPEEDPSLQVFLRNGIFYSYGTDAAERFVNTGGNEAARTAASRDILSVNFLNKFDVNGVYHILTAIVDYCGKRIVCQAPVPGIFNNSEAEEGSELEKVVYGLSSSGTQLFVNEQFQEKFGPIAESFHLKTHKGWANNAEDHSEKEIVTSVETKGLKGTDNRDYIIDLYRTTPLDIEFIESHYNPEVTDSYPHREVTLRHEAVEEWWKRQVAVIIKRESEKLEASKDSKTESDEKPTITIAPNEFALNPDAFSLDPSAASPEAKEELKLDEERVREVSKFVTSQLIPEFFAEISSSKSMVPIDGSHLTSLLHKRGINLRYLGHIATETLKLKEEALAEIALNIEAIKKANETYAATKKEEEEKKADEEVKLDEEKEKKKSKADFTPTVASLKSLYIVVIQEMVARAVKHVMRDYTSNLPLPLIPSCIAHFHNCLLGADINESPKLAVDSFSHLYSDEILSFKQLTPKKVLDLVASEVYIRYRYQLPENWINTLIKPIPLVREIAKKFGIQWAAKNYVFAKEDAEPEKIIVVEQASKAKGKKGKKSASPEAEVVEAPVTFKVEDILSMNPVVKDSIYKSSLVEEVWEAGRVRIQSEEEREVGLNLLVESVQFYEQIYGNVHPQVGKAYSVLAQTYHDLGLSDRACDISRKSVIILERSLGFDSYDTLLALVNSAFFQQVNNNAADALLIYSRVLSDWFTVFGEDHPSVTNTLNNVSSLLQEKKLYKEAVAILNHAISISSKINGEVSQITAMLRYQLGQHYLMQDDIESAISEMQKAHTVFSETVGDEDVLLEDSKKWEEALTAFKARRDDASAKREQELKKMDHGPASHGKKTKKNGKLLQASLNQSTTKKLNKNQNAISVPEIANQSVDDILAFIEGQAPLKKKEKSSKK